MTLRPEPVMSAPEVTVVISAYNEETLVADAIRSVLAQTREDFELVVVDDGSSDGTAEVVRGFETDPRVRLISHSNRGLAASLNVGIAAGSAPFVALLDADDMWMPNFLEQMSTALEADPSAGFAYTEAWWLDQQRGRFFRRSTSEYMGAPKVPPGDPEAFLLAVMPANWVFGLPILRRSALDRVGGFDESLRACEDYELWIRLLANGFMAVRVPGRLVIQRDRSGSMSKDETSMLTNLRQVYEIAVEEPGVPEPARAIARRKIEEIDRLREALKQGRRPARQVARRWLGRMAKVVLARRYWYAETPPEVAAAFPDLDWGRG
jgi:glycosyltransferase involved in cell wall biosynthesis